MGSRKGEHKFAMNITENDEKNDILTTRHNREDSEAQRRDCADSQLSQYNVPAKDAVGAKPFSTRCRFGALMSP